MMENNKYVIVKSIVSGHNRKARIKNEDLTLEVGDMALIGRSNDNLFGSFDVGRVEKIYDEDCVGEDNFVVKVGEGNIVVKDVITNSSGIFKGFKQELRKKEIKREIAGRMKKVDERQRMEMYAESDETIAALVKELDGLQK